MQNLIEVVGIMFFKDGKLLIDKPCKKPTFLLSNTLKNEIVPYCIEKGLIAD